MKGCIVVVSGDDESCSTALIRFGSVCVAGKLDNVIFLLMNLVKLHSFRPRVLQTQGNISLLFLIFIVSRKLS